MADSKAAAPAVGPEAFSLKGKTAFVAGGGGDIGLAIARGLAACGAGILLMDNHPKRLESALGRLKEDGAQACGFTGDITDPEDLRRIAEEAEAAAGVPDILVNATGATARKPILELAEEEWLKIIDINLNGTFYFLKEFGGRMCRRGGGKVIQILSTGAYRFGPNFAAYGASKAGASALIKAVAVEWAPYNVQVNGIAPTATETNFTSDYYAEHPEKKEAAIRNHPYKRLGTPEDYVGAAIYLASSASDFVNGEVIVVDSGKTV